jgi:hypothetical protein
MVGMVTMEASGGLFSTGKMHIVFLNVTMNYIP